MPGSNKRKSNEAGGPAKKSYRKFDALTKQLRNACIKELAQRVIAAKAANESIYGFVDGLVADCAQRVPHFGITRNDINNAVRKINKANTSTSR